MSSIRLYILSSLIERGPMHGHALKNLAEQEHVHEWTDISVGALYGALKRMHADGLVAIERTEREGNYPARQVYGITDGGIAALRDIRARAFATLDKTPDPFDLAFTRLDPDDLDGLGPALVARRDGYREQLEAGRAKIEHIDQYLWRSERLALEHRLHRLEAEIAWHDDLIASVPLIVEDERERRRRKGSKGDTPPEAS
ncbi:PadR family transcriptional regulator [Agromyces protaetiae]|uniref:PadR family transcriptional regulator n=1 Tax=Agromyces protaetiae TaxID=2509455 RepID=UPI0013EC5D30|nr:PadR family transcriptional regulator [Agromyces protaetiae]